LCVALIAAPDLNLSNSFLHLFFFLKSLWLGSVCPILSAMKTHPVKVNVALSCLFFFSSLLFSLQPSWGSPERPPDFLSFLHQQLPIVNLPFSGSDEIATTTTTTYMYSQAGNK